MSKYESDWTQFCKNSKTFESDTVSPHILYDFYIGNEAAREEAELKEAARWELSQQWQCNDGVISPSSWAYNDHYNDEKN